MFQKLLKKIGQILKKNKIPYMITGGQAVLIYGEPRLTKVIDVTLGTGIEDLTRLKKIISELNFTPYM